MKNERAISIIENEKECVYRANMCDRDCANCELLMSDSDIFEAYDTAISALRSDKLQKVRDEICCLQTYLLYSGDDKKVELEDVLRIIDYYLENKNVNT